MPLKLNDDGLAARTQFHPFLQVDPSNGAVVVAWHDARNDSANRKVDYYATRSTDCGVSFEANVKASQPSAEFNNSGISTTDENTTDNPNRNPNQYGEYMGLAAQGGKAYLAWVDSRHFYPGSSTNTQKENVGVAVIDFSGGGGAACGNNLLEPGEVCDGTDLGGQTCVGLGFTGGTLACNGTCSGECSAKDAKGNCVGECKGTCTCPMHPEVRQAGPGRCPKCGMDLERQTPAAGAANRDQATGVSRSSTESTPEPAPGEPRAGLSIDLRRQQLIGVRLSRAERRTITRNTRTVGLVKDETRLSDVNLKVEGWIEDLFVDYTGQPVQRGQRLFAIYSPDLVSTQNEYLLALKTREQLGTSRVDDARAYAERLVASLNCFTFWKVFVRRVERQDPVLWPPLSSDKIIQEAEFSTSGEK